MVLVDAGYLYSCFLTLHAHPLQIALVVDSAFLISCHLFHSHISEDESKHASQGAAAAVRPVGGPAAAASPAICGTATSGEGFAGFDDSTGVVSAGDGVDLGAWISMGRISVLSSLVFFCFGSGAFSFSWT
jgi:hypothetical protein